MRTLRHLVLLSAIVISLIGASSAVSNASPFDPPPPSCGDSIQLQKASANNGNLVFRIVMVDMRRWVGGFGTLTWDAIANNSELGTSPNSPYNAPGGGGVISGQVALYVPGQDTAVNIGVIVYTSGGIEACGAGASLSV